MLVVLTCLGYAWPPIRAGTPLGLNLIRNFTLKLPDIQELRV